MIPSLVSLGMQVKQQVEHTPMSSACGGMKFGGCDTFKDASYHPTTLISSISNLLEFLVVIISIAAATTWLEDTSTSCVSHRDLQILAIPVCQLIMDNDAVFSWVHKVVHDWRKVKTCPDIF
jgi:hypothetical protein